MNPRKSIMVVIVIDREFHTMSFHETMEQAVLYTNDALDEVLRKYDCTFYDRAYLNISSRIRNAWATTGAGMHWDAYIVDTTIYS